MIKKCLKLYEGNMKYLYIFTFALLMLGVFDLLIPISISKIIDYLTIKQLNSVIISILSLLILYLLTNVFTYITHKTYTYFFRNNVISLHKKVVNKIYDLNDEALSKLSKGRIINTINIDVMNISEIADYILDIILNVILIISMAIIFIKTNFIIGIVVLLLDIIYFVLANKLTKKSTYYFKGQRKYIDKLINLLGQTLNGLKEIKTSSIEKALNKKYDYARIAWGNKYMLRRKYLINYKIDLKYMFYIFKILLYFFLTYLLFNNKITIGIIVLLISYYDNIFNYSIEIINDVATTRDYVVSLNRITDLLNYNVNDEIKYGIVNNDYIDGAVEFKDVSFSYKDIPTIKNISFKALPNKMTVIAGKTGSGKTTIFNLLLKLYNPNKGKILIDDEIIENYTKEVYSSNVSVVNQESFMFNMSIKDNLSLIEPNKEKQVEACKRVGIHDFIMTLPNGYETILRENASNLSGGQKRLLSLAKTLLTASEILLFDEVTSSLDPKTTSQILNVLKDLKKDHTVIVITHKKELMKVADNLIILHNGKIVAKGKYNTLNDNKYFNNLIK